MSGRAKHRAVTTSRSGGQASAFTVFAIAAAVGGWLFWRRRKAAEQDNAKAQGPRKQQAGRGGRSTFKFPAGKSSGSSAAQATAFKLPAAAAAAASRPVNSGRSGNPKKANKKQRKLEKEAKKEARQAGLELVHNANLGSSTKEEEEGPVRIKYVDLSKTSDIYDKVREYQESGKKRYP